MPDDPHSTDSAPQSPADWLGEHRFHFDQLVASVVDYAIFMLAVDGVILDWNLGAERLKGYTAEEIMGRHFSIFYPQDEIALDLPANALEIARQTGCFTCEGRRLRKDGTSFWAAVSINAVRTAEGDLAGYLNITRDVTEHRKAEQLLRESEERARLLIENVQDYAIFLLDEDGHVKSWNSGARRIKHYEAHEIVGTHFSVFYPPEAQVMGLPADLLAEARRAGRAEDVGWRVRKDGSTFWGNVIITHLDSANPALRGFAKITRDLTGQRQLETLRKSGKRKDVFLATLAHELRNPLSPLLAVAELLHKKPDDPATIFRMSEIVETQVGHLARLIDDLLDMARITTAKIALRKESVFLADVVATAITTVGRDSERKQHQIICEGLEDPIRLDVDPFRLCQILTNLLSNATRYTPREGTIVLKVSRSDGNTVDITVKDNGIGIPQVVQDSIFDLFDQGAAGTSEGLGIGLTLVKSLTELHGGSVSVYSAGEGCGSEFTVSLPVENALPHGTDPDHPAAPRPRGSAGRIIVADDNVDAADSLGLLLQTRGYDVAVVYDGQAAVDLAKTFSPRLAFLDLGMPRMGGLDAARAMRRILPGVALVALTGWGTEKDREATREASFDLHMVKPAPVDDIWSAIHLLLPTAP